MMLGAEAIHPIKLKRIVADLSLDKEMLQTSSAEKSEAWA